MVDIFWWQTVYAIKIVCLHLLEHGEREGIWEFNVLKVNGRGVEGEAHWEGKLGVHQQCCL